ncbi:MAG: hypothetical protein QOJ62_1133 [Actinomycetota bacterium]|jgi:hypothetical protein|nr:hypothetical protein [Actinomycetota bacterium]
MAEHTGVRPAFYVAGRGAGGWRDWLSLLHPPYTAWHLSYVAIGAALAHPIRLDRLGWSLLGFFLGLGIGAHALDELHGRPLRTGIASSALAGVGLAAIAGAGVVGWLVGGVRLLPFIAVGALLVLAYNLEWFGGLLHTGWGFALSWGAFPLLTGYYAQHWSVSAAAAVAAAAAFGLSWTQRTLSTPARWLRREVAELSVTVRTTGGTATALTTSDLLRPLEQALRVMSGSLVLLALALVIAARH